MGPHPILQLWVRIQHYNYGSASNTTIMGPHPILQSRTQCRVKFGNVVKSLSSFKWDWGMKRNACHPPSNLKKLTALLFIPSLVETRLISYPSPKKELRSQSEFFAPKMNQKRIERSKQKIKKEKLTLPDVSDWEPGGTNVFENLVEIFPAFRGDIHCHRVQTLLHKIRVDHPGVLGHLPQKFLVRGIWGLLMIPDPLGIGANDIRWYLSKSRREWYLGGNIT